MNNKRITLVLLAIIVMIVSCSALYFNSTKKEAAPLGDIEYENDPIIEPVPEDVVRRAAYLSEMQSLKLSSNSREEWFMEYKKLQEKYSDVADEYITIYDVFSEKEINLLFRVVQAEIGDYSFEQICNVTSVIFNRVADGRFGRSLNEVLNPSQFSTISNGAIYKRNPTERVKLACEYVYIFGDTTNGALFFHSNSKSDTFSGYPYRFSDGAHHFY